MGLYTGGLIFGMVRVLVNWWAYTWGGLYSEVYGISCRLSFSKLELALMIAVVIFPILSTVFLAMYFTTDGNACRRQNNKGNESKNCTVKCSANQTKSHNSGTG